MAHGPIGGVGRVERGSGAFGGHTLSAEAENVAVRLGREPLDTTVARDLARLPDAEFALLAQSGLQLSAEGTALLSAEQAKRHATAMALVNNIG